jgi:hypothetical protein
MRGPLCHAAWVLETFLCMRVVCTWICMDMNATIAIQSLYVGMTQLLVLCSTQNHFLFVKSYLSGVVICSICVLYVHGYVCYNCLS